MAQIDGYVQVTAYGRAGIEGRREPDVEFLRNLKAGIGDPKSQWIEAVPKKRPELFFQSESYRGHVKHLIGAKGMGRLFCTVHAS